MTCRRSRRGWEGLILVVILELDSIAEEVGLAPDAPHNSVLARVREEVASERIREVPVVTTEDRSVLYDVAETVEKATAVVAELTARVDAELGREAAKPLPAPTPPAPARPRQTPRPVAPNGEGPTLKAGAKRMLEALARHEGVCPQGLDRRELSTLALVAKGGTLSDYLSALRAEGFIFEDLDPPYAITDAGRAYVEALWNGGPHPGPMVTAEIVAGHYPKLKAGARRMLDVLLRSPEQGFTRGELGGLANVAKGGTLSDYLSALRAKGLIDERAKRIFPSATLYIADRRMTTDA